MGLSYSKYNPKPRVLYEVRLNVYDINYNNRADSLQRVNDFLYYIGHGLYHIGIEVQGHELMYSMTGICSHTPRTHDTMRFRTSIHLGYTDIDVFRLRQIVAKLNENQFRPADYRTLTRNCIHFAVELANLLGVGRGLPAWTTRTLTLVRYVFGPWQPSVEELEGGNSIPEPIVPSPGTKPVE